MLILRLLFLVSILVVAALRVAEAQQREEGPSCDARLAIAQQYAQSLLQGTMEREAATLAWRGKLADLLGKPRNDPSTMDGLLAEVQARLHPPSGASKETKHAK